MPWACRCRKIKTGDFVINVNVFSEVSINI